MMTDSAICREYRMAKDKDKQIEIIADQCRLTKDVVVKVLVDCGEMEAPAEKSKLKAKAAKKSEEPAVVPAVVLDLVYRRIDELNEKIKPLEDELKSLKAEFEQIAAFLKGCGKECHELGGQTVKET